MKNILLFTLFLLVNKTLFAQTNKFVGDWQGVLNAGGVNIKIIFHFTKNEIGIYAGKLDVPQQGANGLEMTETTITNDSIRSNATNYGFLFLGKSMNDSIIIGEWQQGAATLPLGLKRIAALQEEGKINRSKYDSVANYVIRNMNQRNGDSIYNMTNSDFRQYAPKEYFHEFINSFISSVGGKLDSLTFKEIQYPNVYYVVHSQVGLWQLTIGLDKKDSIATLLIKEYRPAKDFPQTPKPPFSYNSEDVTFYNADKSIQFGATLTYPKTGNKFITAVMITGSGQQDRDENLFGHKPFAVIADYLTKNGYAVLRMDDRGVGKTTGAPTLDTATSADFAKDIEAAVQYLRTRKDVEKIGLIGHSEGGLIAPIVAATDKKIAFIISLAGVGVPGKTIMYHQWVDNIQPDKVISKDASEKNKDWLKFILGFIVENPTLSRVTMIDSLSNHFITWEKTLPDSVIQQLKLNESDNNNIFKKITQAWLRYFICSDAPAYWKQVKCPVLALNGEKDFQVYARENTEGIRNALMAGGNKNVTVKVFPGLNHLFQTCKSCNTIAEYGELEETFSPEVLKTMVDWLDKNLKK